MSILFKKLCFLCHANSGQQDRQIYIRKEDNKVKTMT